MKSARVISWGLVAATAASLLLPTAAHAGRTGRRNTAIALGAVAAYGVIKKKPLLAGVAGAGAVYSYVRSQQSERRRRRPRRRVYAYRPAAPVRTVTYVPVSSGHTPPGWSRGRKVGWAKHGKY